MHSLSHDGVSETTEHFIENDRSLSGVNSIKKALQENGSSSQKASDGH